MNEHNILKQLNISEVAWQELLAKFNLSEKNGIIKSLLTDIIAGRDELDEFVYNLARNQGVKFIAALQLYQELYSKYFLNNQAVLDKKRLLYLEKVAKGTIKPKTKKVQLARSLIVLFKDLLDSNEVQHINQQLSGNMVSDMTAAKEKFYEAINNQDKLDFLTSLAIFFSSGNLAKIFKDDKRYHKFWRTRLLKEQGLEGVRNFDENPVSPRSLSNFIKYVLEQRFKMSEQESPLWGAYLSSLAHSIGDSDFEKIAYGDLMTQKFKWNF